MKRKAKKKKIIVHVNQFHIKYNLKHEKKKVSLDSRITEIFEKWQKRDESENERIDEYLKMLFENDPACLIYAELDSSLPPYSDEFQRFGDEVRFSAAEYNFVYKKGEEKYHPHCYKQILMSSENKKTEEKKY